MFGHFVQFVLITPEVLTDRQFEERFCTYPREEHGQPDLKQVTKISRKRERRHQHYVRYNHLFILRFTRYPFVGFLFLIRDRAILVNFDIHPAQILPIYERPNLLHLQFSRVPALELAHVRVIENVDLDFKVDRRLLPEQEGQSAVP